jgi:chloramphenicol 3-O-phosphotransferase
VLTEAENMAAVWGNYLRAGPRQLVVAGVIASSRDQQRYEDTFALPVRSVRLVASAASTEARLRRRYSEQQSGTLNWHLERHSNLADRLAAQDLDELVIDTDSMSPHEVAVRVLEHFGLS